MPSRFRLLPGRPTAGFVLAAAALVGAVGVVALAPPGVAVLAAAGLAVALVLAVAVRDRRAAARERAALAAEVRTGEDRLAAQADQIARQKAQLRANEARLADTLRAARMVAWEWDTATGGVTLSGPARDWVGSRQDFDPDEADPLAAFVHPDDQARVAAARQKVLDGAAEFEAEYRLLRTDGRAVWVLSRGQRARDDRGRPTGRVTGVLVDVTARREGEARFRLLESAVVHARDAVVVLEATPGPGTGRRVRYANDAFFRMTGYAPGEVLGRSLHLLKCPDADPAALARVRAALDAGRPVRTDLRNRKKDGSPYWVDLSLVPVPDPAIPAEPSGGGREPDAGRPVAHWVMIQRDVTDRNRAEDALRRSEALFRAVFDGASAGFSLTDDTGRFVACNPAFAALIGRPVGRVLGRTPAAFTHPDDWAAQAPLMAAVRAGTRDRFDAAKRYVRPDGAVVWAELSFAAIRGADGRFEYGFAVSVDVTERRKLEEQLRQAQKMEAIGQMAGGVAHDFNNLLTAVIGNLSLAALPPGDPNRPLLAAAEGAAARAADLTKKLLGYARRNQLLVGPVAPREAFAEVVGLLKRTLDPRIVLRVEVAPGCGPAVADPGLLNQALMNLCLNARDAMPDGGTLTLSAGPADAAPPPPAEGDGVPDAAAGPFVRLSVSDTGYGMTDAVKARIFDPFFTTKDVGKGTGLGLPMVHGIVKQHNGWVTCTSAPGGGTRIDLYLPAAETSAEGGPGLPVPTAGSPESSETPPDGTPTLAATERGAVPADPLILLVDDEPMIRDLGRAILERGGYRVITAEDGADAVEVFARERGRVGLVVLDVMMPRMSGKDAFGHLVRLDPGVKVLFSTGYSAEELPGLDGSVGLLNKPYRPAELLAAVRDALAGSPVPVSG